MFEKVMEFARNGKGRRLLNALNKKECSLTNAQLEAVLKCYCDTGLPKEVEMLTSRRGILAKKQYNAMAAAVRENCSAATFDDFSAALRKLLSSGMTMNPLKTDMDNLTG